MVKAILVKRRDDYVCYFYYALHFRGRLRGNILTISEEKKVTDNPYMQRLYSIFVNFLIGAEYERG